MIVGYYLVFDITDDILLNLVKSEGNGDITTFSVTTDKVTSLYHGKLHV